MIEARIWILVIIVGHLTLVAMSFRHNFASVRRRNHIVDTTKMSIRKVDEILDSKSIGISYPMDQLTKVFKALVVAIPLFASSCIPLPVKADDELAKYAAAGNSVGVDGKCFFKKCSVQTLSCANDQTCVKGLACLARCKGGSMCSTGCFAKYGSETLDKLLYCSVEENDCVQVPGKGNLGWVKDKLSDLPSKPIEDYDIKSLSGTWYKVMGLDSRYDCFDCQRNSFNYENKNTLRMEALFRIPRPTFPGYFQNKILEELHAADSTNSLATLQSQGRMFGLTFWENWYILGDTARSKPLQLYGIPSAYAANQVPDLKLVYYTGHTLQGSYKGLILTWK